jgi:hypothetical protein
VCLFVSFYHICLRTVGGINLNKLPDQFSSSLAGKTVQLVCSDFSAWFLQSNSGQGLQTD